LTWHVHENEELKLKLASLMEEAKANAEEIAKLRKKVVAHEEECCVS